jgi:cell division protein FtsL
MKLLGAERSSVSMIALAVAVVALAALLHVWVRLQVIAIGYDLSRETRAKHDLGEAHQRLSLELRTRMDLAVIERAAKEQLKMAPPDPRSIRVLPVDEVAVNTSANAADAKERP